MKRVVRGCEFTLYGFKSNKWLMAPGNKTIPFVYSRVSDEFDLDDIESYDRYFNDPDFWIRHTDERMTVLCKSDVIGLRDCEHLSTTEDAMKLYPLIEIIIELADALDVDVDYDFTSDSIEYIIEFIIDEIAIAAKKNYEMLNLLKGKELFNLLEQLHSHKSDLDKEKTRGKEHEDEINKLKGSLKEKDDEINSLKLQLSQLQIKTNELISSQQTYKQDLITAVRETLSKM